jgi:predicted transposase/invertase (TIGR01784 family)
MASQRPVSSKKTAAVAAPATKTAAVAPESPRFRHDLFFKEFFGFLACAEGLMREVLPAPFIPAIEWEKMTLEPTVVVAENLIEKRVDLLFRAPLKYAVDDIEDECCCFLHLEGQSTFDKSMGSRIFFYHGALWSKHEQESKSDSRPVIFPVVIYNGKTPWKGEKNFGHTVGKRLPPELRAAAEPYIPKFEFIVVDVVRMEEEKLAGKGWHKIGLDVLRIARNGDFTGFIRRNAKKIKEMKAAGEQQEKLLKTVLKYFVLLAPEGGKKGLEDLRETLNLLPEEERDETMTILELLHEEGLEKGIGIGVERGRHEGREEGRHEGREEGELIGEIRAYQRMAGMRVSDKQELSGKPVSEMKKLLAQVRRECLAVAR